MVNITIQQISKAKLPLSKKQIKQLMDQVLPSDKKNYEINLRFVTAKESKILNKKYRKKNQPTNIISFQFEAPYGVTTRLLGDLVICMPLVKKEAKLQYKTVTAHLTHLIIHGVLHLLGYVHDTKKNARKMEKLEIKYLKKLGIENPY